MFPEYTDVIQKLRENNPHFAKIFEEHNSLDREITKLELDPVNHVHCDIEAMKRQKLRLKDALYQLLRAYPPSELST